MAKNATTTRCLCGCGDEVQRKFRPGHDGRYLGQLLAAAKLAALTRPEVEALAGRVSDAFAQKLTPYLDQLDQQRTDLRAALLPEEDHE